MKKIKFNFWTNIRIVYILVILANIGVVFYLYKFYSDNIAKAINIGDNELMMQTKAKNDNIDQKKLDEIIQAIKDKKKYNNPSNLRNIFSN